MRSILLGSLLLGLTSGCGSSSSAPKVRGGTDGSAPGESGGAAGQPTTTGTGGAEGGAAGIASGGVSGGAGMAGNGGTAGATAVSDLPLCAPCGLDTECAAPNVCARPVRSEPAGFCAPRAKITKCCAGSDAISICFNADGWLNLPKLQCASPKPAPAATITDFGGVDAATGGFVTSGLSGFVFTSEGLTRDVSGGALHVTGPVATFGFFAVAFDCVDASRYGGITFKVSGNVGASGMLTVAVNTEADTAREVGGTCVADLPMCRPPSKSIAVGASATTLSLAWGDLMGGTPRSTVDATRIHSVVWTFAFPTSSYAVDVTVDDLAFW